MLSLDDARAKSVGEVIGNETCKKIVAALVESNEQSAEDLAKKLGLPLNTTQYNLEKLLKAGLIEKAKNFFWSRRGKKIVLYTLSNTSIIIEPKESITTKFKSFVPVAIFGGLAGLIIRGMTAVPQVPTVSETSMDLFAAKVAEGTTLAQNAPLIMEPSTSWLWFVTGMIFALLVFAVYNWRKL